MSNIKELQHQIGFYPSREIKTLEAGEPHDETFSYQLARDFYNNEKALEKPISLTKKIIYETQYKLDFDKLTIFYSLLGDMYYIYGDFSKSLGCYMNALSYNRKDLASWVGLMFSLRALGEFELFEKIIFNLEQVYNKWVEHKSVVMDKNILLQLLN